MILNHYHLNVFYNLYKEKYGEPKVNSLFDYNYRLSQAGCTKFYINALDQTTNILPVKVPFTITKKTTTKQFSDICDSRAQTIIKQAKDTNKKIIVLWSGGIDSHLILVSLLKHNADVTVALTAQSVLEHRKFYENFIRNKLDIVFYHDLPFNPDINSENLYVGSNMADALVGGSFIVYYLYSNYEESRRNVLVNGNIDVEAISNYWQMLNRPMPRQYAEFFVEQVKKAANNLDVDISNWWKFWSFADFLYRSSHECWMHWGKYYQWKASPDALRNLDQWDVHFFMDQEFYNWALHTATLEDKIGHNIFSYKKAYKDYIYEFDGDRSYRDYKLKISSLAADLPRTVIGNYIGLDSNFNSLNPDNINEILEYLYTQNNQKFL